jgi:fatty acid synthase, animal type
MSDIVISGISGKFPNADNVQDLSDKLFDKVYLVSDSEKRFKCNLSSFPKKVGLINGLDKCDASGTRTSLVLIKTSDPQLRLLSEVVCEAIFDAGLNMEELKNTNTGVYVGCSNYDALAFWHTHQSLAGMASIANSAYSMSNRLSYMLDTKGPSMTIDTACSSSFYALNAAVNDIKIGKCDSAVVAGSNLILHPMGMEEGVRLVKYCEKRGLEILFSI